VSEYDRRAEAWVRARYPRAQPDPGSVEFSNDCAAYASGGWASVDVSWAENGQVHCESLSEAAWQYDWTQIIRELLDIDLSGEAA